MAPRELAYGQVGNWHTLDGSGKDQVQATIAVEMDTAGATGSLVVYIAVDADNFQPDDQVSFVMSETARAALAGWAVPRPFS